VEFESYSDAALCGAARFTSVVGKMAMASEVELLAEWASGVPHTAHRVVYIASTIWTEAYRVDRGVHNAGIEALRSLKRLGIREDRLVKLFTICKCKWIYFHALLRAESLGILTAAEINSAIDEDRPLDLNHLLAQVKNQLPEFGLDTYELRYD
jgi:hypothetical protein